MFSTLGFLPACCLGLLLSSRIDEHQLPASASIDPDFETLLSEYGIKALSTSSSAEDFSDLSFL